MNKSTDEKTCECGCGMTRSQQESIVEITNDLCSRFNWEEIDSVVPASGAFRIMCMGIASGMVTQHIEMQTAVYLMANGGRLLKEIADETEIQ